MSPRQQTFLAILDRFVDEDSPEMDVARRGDIRTARALAREGVVTVRDGADESGIPCVWVRRVEEVEGGTAVPIRGIL